MMENKQMFETTNQSWIIHAKQFWGPDLFVVDPCAFSCPHGLRRPRSVFQGNGGEVGRGFFTSWPRKGCHLVAFAKLSNSFSSIRAAMKALPLAIKRPNLKEDHPNLVQLSFALSNVLTSVLCRRPLAVHPVQLRPANLCGWNPKTPKRFANHTMWVP